MKLRVLMFAVAFGLAGRSEAGAIPGATLDIIQDGDNVVSTVSGAIDLAGLTFAFPAIGGTPEIHPSNAYALVGFGNFDVYSGISGPKSLGSDVVTFSSSSAGDPFAVEGIVGYLWLQRGYISGTALSGSATYNDATLASLGLAPGTYLYTWSPSPGEDGSLTVQIGTTVPEAGTWIMMLIGFAGLGPGRAFGRKVANLLA
jgi:hypothetical protein